MEMSHYITNNLEDGELIVFHGRLHWISVYQYIFSALLMLLIVIGLLVIGLFTSRYELHIAGAVFFVIAIVIYTIGWLFRTRSEFAITNNRFIQKDGIMNIKMTEIPLFKIETVNFYQSFWQRVLGTGSIELVGSGGTFHRVNYIEKPLIVRKMIVSEISRNQKSE